MTAEALYETHASALTRRLERMVGSRETAEDLRQEAFLRLWSRAPGDLPESKQRAWLERTASNLAIDELRRRRLRDHSPLDEAAVAAITPDGSEALAVSDALARISSHERLLVLLRFQAGLTNSEIGELLAISAAAAQKRVGTAKRAFAAAYRGSLGETAPVILLETSEDPPRYRDWLAAAGADVQFVRPGDVERQVAFADAIVIGASDPDIDPSLYGERRRVVLIAPDLATDVRELRLVRAALEASLPCLGICRGVQLMNVALGGSLFQDIESDGATRRPHWQVEHEVSTHPETAARRILGRTAVVSSEHHQAVRGIGRGLTTTSCSEDSIYESLELSGDRLVLGLLWHPEREQSGEAGRRVARALVDAAADSRARRNDR
jgi:putative glutamine amidotransferase